MALPRLTKIIIVLLVLIVGVVLLFDHANNRNEYYRKLYDTCLVERSMNGIYTQFDVYACESLVSRARDEHKFEEQQ